jgi:LacI family transcriptional regulator
VSAPREETDRRPVGVREVAKHANVAISSVSRVLSDHPDVSDDMRARVLAAAKELGYEPDFLAQSLRRGATLSVGFVVRDISNPVLAEIALGAETTLHESGYSMLLTNSEGQPELDAAGIRLFRRRRVDGLLLSLSDETRRATLAEIRQLSIPVVLIDRQLEGPHAHSAVLADHATSAREVVRTLVELGHRVIGLVLGPSGIFPMRVCAEVFDAEVSSAGAELIVESGALTPEQGMSAAARLLDLAEPPTALVVPSNQLFVGALHTVRERGIAVPDQLSLVSFDDIPLLDLLDPPVSVVSRHPLELGHAAASELIRRVREPGARPRVVTTPTSFERRASVGPPPS